MRLATSNEVLSNHLNGLLESVDISRLELAKRMGVADGTLGRIKYGQANPTLDVVDRIAKFFHRQPWELLKPKEAGEAASGAALDVVLLNRALEMAIAQFHAHGWMPATHQIAAAASFIYQHVNQGQSWKMAEKSVGEMLAKHGTGAFVQTR